MVPAPDTAKAASRGRVPVSVFKKKKSSSKNLSTSTPGSEKERGAPAAGPAKGGEIQEVVKTTAATKPETAAGPTAVPGQDDNVAQRSPGRAGGGRAGGDGQTPRRTQTAGQPELGPRAGTGRPWVSPALGLLTIHSGGTTGSPGPPNSESPSALGAQRRFLGGPWGPLAGTV